MTTEREQILALSGEPQLYGFEDGELVCAQDMVLMAHKTGQRVIPFYTEEQLLVARKPLEEEIERVTKGWLEAFNAGMAHQEDAKELHRQLAEKCAEAEEIAAEYNKLLDVSITLNQQLADRDAEIAGLHDQLEEPQITADEFRIQAEQLASAQAENLRLREVIELHNNCTECCRHNGDDLVYLPSSTSALSALITKAGEVMRERCWQTAQPDDSYQDEWFKAKADSCGRIRSIPPITLEDWK